MPVHERRETLRESPISWEDPTDHIDEVRNSSIRKRRIITELIAAPSVEPKYSLPALERRRDTLRDSPISWEDPTDNYIESSARNSSIRKRRITPELIAASSVEAKSSLPVNKRRKEAPRESPLSWEDPTDDCIETSARNSSKRKRRIKPELIAASSVEPNSSLSHPLDSEKAIHQHERKLPPLLSRVRAKRQKVLSPKLRNSSSSQKETLEESFPFEPKQQWTELTAVGQILADEIRTYQETHKSKMCKGEIQALSEWSNAVQNHIYHQSTAVLENVKVATELRKAQKEVQYLRDDLMVIGRQTKQLQANLNNMGDDAEKTEKEASALEGATCFLNTLQSLAKAAIRDAK